MTCLLKPSGPSIRTESSLFESDLVHFSNVPVFVNQRMRDPSDMPRSRSHRSVQPLCAARLPKASETFLGGWSFP
jgi:hypothetical protein